MSSSKKRKLNESKTKEEDREECDVVFIVEEREVWAISAKLPPKLKCDVFDDVVLGKLKVSKNKSTIASIPMTDTTYEAFKRFIDYMNSDETDIRFGSDVRISIELFRIGHKYQLTALLDRIEKRIYGLIYISNFELIYRFAKQYNLKNLAKRLNQFIDKNIDYFKSKTGNQLKEFNELTNYYLVIKQMNDELEAKDSEVMRLRDELAKLRAERAGVGHQLDVKPKVENNFRYKWKLNADDLKLPAEIIGFNKSLKF